MRSSPTTNPRGPTHPRVKTFSSEVLPQAPSPLWWDTCRQLIRHHVKGPVPPPSMRCSGERDKTHSKTSLRCTVLEPPIPQGIVATGTEMNTGMNASGSCDQRGGQATPSLCSVRCAGRVVFRRGFVVPVVSIGGGIEGRIDRRRDEGMIASGKVGSETERERENRQGICRQKEGRCKRPAADPVSR